MDRYSLWFSEIAGGPQILQIASNIKLKIRFAVLDLGKWNIQTGMIFFWLCQFQWKQSQTKVWHFCFPCTNDDEQYLVFRISPCQPLHMQQCPKQNLRSRKMWCCCSWSRCIWSQEKGNGRTKETNVCSLYFMYINLFILLNYEMWTSFGVDFLLVMYW